MKKPSETIKEKQRKMIEDFEEKTDILAAPFLNMLQQQTIEWIIEELDNLTPQGE